MERGASTDMARRTERVTTNTLNSGFTGTAGIRIMAATGDARPRAVPSQDAIGSRARHRRTIDNHRAGRSAIAEPNERRRR